MTMQVGQYQKDKPFWILWSKDDGVAVASAGLHASHLHLAPVQTDSHDSTSSLKFFTGQLLFLTPNQQHQSTKDTTKRH